MFRGKHGKLMTNKMKHLIFTEKRLETVKANLSQNRELVNAHVSKAIREIEFGVKEGTK